MLPSLPCAHREVPAPAGPVCAFAGARVQFRRTCRFAAMSCRRRRPAAPPRRREGENGEGRPRAGALRPKGRGACMPPAGERAGRRRQTARSCASGPPFCRRRTERRPRSAPAPPSRGCSAFRGPAWRSSMAPCSSAQGLAGPPGARLLSTVLAKPSAPSFSSRPASSAMRSRGTFFPPATHCL